MADRKAPRSNQTQHHISGRLSRSAPPPVERGRHEGRPRRPGCYLMAGLMLAIVVTASVVFALLFFLSRDHRTTGTNAVWLGISWGQEVHEDAEVQNLTRILRSYGIDTAYVWVSWLQGDGTWSETTFDNIGAFVGQFKQYYPEARLDAWIGVPVDVPEYRLDDETVRTDVAEFAARTITEFGFDAVHINAEPVWDGDESFPLLLRDVRREIGEDVTLSVAVPPDWNAGVEGIPVGPYTTEDAHWSQEYKQRIAFLTDELVIMAYNSGLSVAADYETWMAFQVERYISAIAPLDIGTQVVVGIPTYDAELPGHDPAVESVESAVAGVELALQKQEANAEIVRGLGIYAYWSTDPAEWQAFREYWVQPAAEQ